MSDITATLINKVTESKEIVQKKLFKQWVDEQDADKREELYAKMHVLSDIIFTLNKTIRDDYK